MLHGMLVGAAVALALVPAEADDELYAPTQPEEPSLSASAFGECVRDAPWIQYDVTLVDPDGQSTSRDVSLVFAKGDLRHEMPLGTLDSGNRLAGRVLWPAAVVDESGTGLDWPGWVLEEGEWLDVGDGDLGWTREGATVTLEVNPEIVVAVSYPPATPYCVVGPRLTSTPSATRPPSAPTATAGLAATGVDVALPLLVGAGLLAGGFAMVAGRRRSRR